MSEYSIQIRDLGKMYRLFSRPVDKVWDALGMEFFIKGKKHQPQEFWALRGLNLDIKKGERVGIIGRNGAGKSTLLKIICGNLTQTEGEMKVNGKIQALLELGTGFHPEFSGRENIRSYLAYQGLTQQQIAAREEEIIDFAELEEFIEQPLKTYSAGMYARLAFSTATAIEPEILIIDEVLGAGDAYFAGKCVERMERLTQETGVTVLFVSHDMNSVQLLCERAIWIDHGAIRMQGDMLAISKAYMAHIRAEDELRLRAKAMSMNKKELEHMKNKGEGLLFHLVGEQGAPKYPLWVSKIILGSGDEVLCRLNVASASWPPFAELFLDSKTMNWGEEEKHLGVQCRRFDDFGGHFLHAAWMFHIESFSEKAMWIQIEYASEQNVDVYLELYNADEQNYTRLYAFEQSEKWTVSPKVSIPYLKNESGNQVEKFVESCDLQTLKETDRYGSGEVIITAFGFLGDNGKRCHTVVSGAAISAVFHILSFEESIKRAVAVVAIYRADGVCATQLISNRDGVEFELFKGNSLIRLSTDRFALGPGDYMVSIALFKSLNLASNVEPEAYDLHDRCYPLKVLAPLGVGVDIGTVNQPVNWQLEV